MAGGPNSAPNGEGGLVRGYAREEFTYDKTVNRYCDEDTCTGMKEHSGCYVSLRVFLSRTNRLRTGKTQ